MLFEPERFGCSSGLALCLECHSLLHVESPIILEEDSHIQVTLVITPKGVAGRVVLQSCEVLSVPDLEDAPLFDVVGYGYNLNGDPLSWPHDWDNVKGICNYTVQGHDFVSEMALSLRNVDEHGTPFWRIFCHRHILEA